MNDWSFLEFLYRRKGLINQRTFAEYSDKRKSPPVTIEKLIEAGNRISQQQYDTALAEWKIEFHVTLGFLASKGKILQNEVDQVFKAWKKNRPRTNANGIGLILEISKGLNSTDLSDILESRIEVRYRCQNDHCRYPDSIFSIRVFNPEDLRTFKANCAFCKKALLRSGDIPEMSLIEVVDDANDAEVPQGFEATDIEQQARDTVEAGRRFELAVGFQDKRTEVMSTIDTPPRVQSAPNPSGRIKKRIAPVAGRRRFGPWVADRELNSGGFGRVYLAHRVGNENEKAAIKVPIGELSADMLRRFEREAKVSQGISCENVVLCFDYSLDPPFIAFEYVDGPDLESEERPVGGKRPLGDVVLYAEQILNGLQAIHEHEIVHRDLKPANIIIEKRTGKLKIADFGFAREEGSKFTQTKMIIGTPNYMSPEQTWSARSVTERSDLFSFGAVLFFLIAGRAPYSAVNIKELYKKLRDAAPVPSIIKFDDRITADFARFVMKLLEKDPKDRFQTAHEAMGELASLKKGGRVERPRMASQISAVGLHSGEYIRGYRLLGRLGLGEAGMSEVWKAQRGEDEHIAIKVALPANSETKDSASLRNEWECSSVIQSTCVVRPLEVGHDKRETGDIHFLCMEYVPGPSLKTLVSQVGKLTPDVAKLFLRDAALGLEAIHRAGIVHRDIKPSNMVVSPQKACDRLTMEEAHSCRLKIADFGIACTSKALRLRSGASAGIPGTLAYVAPERFGGITDYRSDLYSLGISFYFALTSGVPFEGTRKEIEVKHCEDVPDPVILDDSTIPIGLSLMVECMLLKNRMYRYQNAREILRDLELLDTNEKKLIRALKRRVRAGRESMLPPHKRTKIRLLAAAIFVIIASIFGTVKILGPSEGRVLESNLTSLRSSFDRCRDGSSAELMETLPLLFANLTNVERRLGVASADDSAFVALVAEQAREWQIVVRFTQLADSARKEFDLTTSVRLFRQSLDLKPNCDTLAVHRDWSEACTILADVESGYRDMIQEVAVLRENEEFTLAFGVLQVFMAANGRRVSWVSDSVLVWSDSIGKLSKENPTAERALGALRAARDSFIASGDSSAFRSDLQAIVEDASFLHTKARRDAITELANLDAAERDAAEAALMALLEEADRLKPEDGLRKAGYYRAYNSILRRIDKRFLDVEVVRITWEAELEKSRQAKAAEAERWLVRAQRNLRERRLATVRQDIEIIEQFGTIDVERILKLQRRLGTLEDLRSTMVSIPTVDSYTVGDELIPEAFPCQDVSLPSFFIDRVETSVVRYKVFLDDIANQGRCSAFCESRGLSDCSHLPSRWDSQLQSPTLPVVGITWFDAAAYASWAGLRLPTEFEWEFAARGPDRFEFPWGAVFSRGMCHCNAEGPRAVTDFAVGASKPFGLLNMAGNVYEWTDSWFEPYHGGRFRRDVHGEIHRVLRGGSFSLDPRDGDVEKSLRCAVRYWLPPATERVDVGFRCAWDGNP